MPYHTITRIDEAQVHYDHHTGWSVTLHACGEASAELSRALRRTIAQDPIGIVVESG